MGGGSKKIKTASIPKGLTKGRGLVVISRQEYEKLLKLLRRRRWEVEDTEEAVEVFNREKEEGKLEKVDSLEEIE